MRSLLFLIAFSFSAIAQIGGLPEYGVLLDGTVNAPVLHNNTSKHILAYALRYDNERTATITSFLFQRSWPPPPDISGIAPGATFTQQRGDVEVEASIKGLPIVPVHHTSVALDAVLFEDGHLIGPDVGGLFQSITGQIEEEQEVAAILLNASDRGVAWIRIESIVAPMPPSQGTYRNPQVTYHQTAPWRSMYARQLLQTRARSGEAAAIEMAESTKHYPTVVKER